MYRLLSRSLSMKRAKASRSESLRGDDWWAKHWGPDPTFCLSLRCSMIAQAPLTPMSGTLTATVN